MYKLCVLTWSVPFPPSFQLPLFSIPCSCMYAHSLQIERRLKRSPAPPTMDRKHWISTRDNFITHSLGFIFYLLYWIVVVVVFFSTSRGTRTKCCISFSSYIILSIRRRGTPSIRNKSGLPQTLRIAHYI